mmetsp:Transcript_14428/g.20232  ORF Transcript_14428/g.20232 Transcript_14428/m.20232 type:complete len:82 (+) Transcript_14428:612-857(+)
MRADVQKGARDVSLPIIRWNDHRERTTRIYAREAMVEALIIEEDVQHSQGARSSALSKKLTTSRAQVKRSWCIIARAHVKH